MKYSPYGSKKVKEGLKKPLCQPSRALKWSMPPSSFHFVTPKNNFWRMKKFPQARQYIN